MDLESASELLRSFGAERDREHRRVVIDADAHEAVVGCDVVHAVRNRLAHGVVGEVVNVYQLRLALRW